jgi:hypothetical protein
LTAVSHGACPKISAPAKVTGLTMPMDETYPFFQWIIVNIPTFVKISDGQLADPVLPQPTHLLQKQL